MSSLMGMREFSELDGMALQAYAAEKAEALGLRVADAYLANVLDNLRALQTHAAILTTRLERRSALTLWTSPWTASPPATAP